MSSSPIQQLPQSSCAGRLTLAYSRLARIGTCVECCSYLEDIVLRHDDQLVSVLSQLRRSEPHRDLCCHARSNVAARAGGILHLRHRKLRRFDWCQFDALHDSRDVDQADLKLVDVVLLVVAKDHLRRVAAQRPFLDVGGGEACLNQSRGYLLAVNLRKLGKALSLVTGVLLEVDFAVDACEDLLVFELFMHCEFRCILLRLGVRSQCVLHGLRM